MHNALIAKGKSEMMGRVEQLNITTTYQEPVTTTFFSLCAAVGCLVHARSVVSVNYEGLTNFSS
jgi:hypothetical protein